MIRRALAVIAAGGIFLGLFLAWLRLASDRTRGETRSLCDRYVPNTETGTYDPRCWPADPSLDDWDPRVPSGRGGI